MSTKEIVSYAGLWLDSYALHLGANRVNVDGETPAIDVTSFSDTSRVKLLDTPGATITGAGFMDDSFEKGLFDLWGLDGKAITVSKKRLPGEQAYVAKVTSGTYQMNATRGQAWAFTLAAEATGGLFGNGRMLQVGTDVAVSGSGADQTLRAVSALRKAIGTLHVSKIGGTLPTLNVVIESDDNSGFTTPVTRLTFAAVTGAGGITGEVVSVTGPITDTHWRAKWTVGGTLPLFDFAVALGFEEGL